MIRAQFLSHGQSQPSVALAINPIREFNVLPLQLVFTISQAISVKMIGASVGDCEELLDSYDRARDEGTKSKREGPEGKLPRTVSNNFV
jgi:hypothetical protein